MRNFLREPLLHFTLIGVLLFAAYAWIGRGEPAGSPAATPGVMITAAQVQWLQQGFARQWRRPPTDDETRGLVADLLREQLLAREARSLGLDADDTVVRRRLAQKMSFVVEDTVRLAEPTDAELRRLYEANPTLTTMGPRVSFEHVYFSGARRTDPVADAKAALPMLARNPAAAERVGDPLLVDAAFDAADRRAVAATFGDEFADAVFALPAGGWHGPIESGFGWHLVRVTSVVPGRRAEFAQARSQLVERWREERQREAMQRYFAGLLAKYPVTVEDSVRPLVGTLEPAQLAFPPRSESGAGR